MVKKITNNCNGKNIDAGKEKKVAGQTIRVSSRVRIGSVGVVAIRALVS